MAKVISILQCLLLVHGIIGSSDNSFYADFLDDSIDFDFDEFDDSDFLDRDSLRVLSSNSTDNSTDVDYCEDEVCLNDGVCTSGSSAAICTCANGFTGDTCETEEQKTGITVTSAIKLGFSVDLGDMEPDEFVSTDDFKTGVREGLASTFGVDANDVWITSISASLSRRRRILIKEDRNTRGRRRLEDTLDVAVEFEVYAEDVTAASSIAEVVESDNFTDDLVQNVNAAVEDIDSLASIVTASSAVVTELPEIVTSGVDCGDYELSNAACSLCDESACYTLECDNGYLDSDGSVTNGCEYKEDEVDSDGAVVAGAVVGGVLSLMLIGMAVFLYFRSEKKSGEKNAFLVESESRRAKV